MKPMPHEDERDRELAAILEEALGREAARRPTLEELVAAHPHVEQDLRQLWGAVMVVDAIAAKQDDGTTSRLPAAGGGRFNGPQPTPPRQLGDFELGEEIGRGGMGVVYRARQQSLGRDAAVKVMLRGASASTGEEARFRAEAEAAAQLDHSHIVPIYDAGESNGWRYIGMKLIEGQTLAQRLALGAMNERDAARIVMIASRAIQYAHDRGVVHRDLKPANILLDADGVPFVSDFGLAKRESPGASLTTTGAIVGTPLYMAPEQAAGRSETTPSCDVFSLGAILYALLTGRPPFQASSPVGTLLQLLEQDPTPPRELNPQLSRDLEMIVLRAIQKPPELRYPSAGALAEDLQAYLAGEPVAARSGRFGHVVARVFGDTHHAAVLENWGVLWMWHAAVLMILCGVTNWLHLRRTEWPVMQSHWPYLVLWGGGLAVWAPIFWAVRRRSGPVTAVERQIAHAWGGSIVAVVLLFVVEWILGYEVLALSPVLGLISGMVFVVKAGILSGTFYIHAAALFACGVAMAVMDRAGSPYGPTLFGVVSAAAFFVPGLKYFRESRRQRGLTVSLAWR